MFSSETWHSAFMHHIWDETVLHIGQELHDDVHIKVLACVRHLARDFASEGRSKCSAIRSYWVVSSLGISNFLTTSALRRQRDGVFSLFRPLISISKTLCASSEYLPSSSLQL